MFYAGLNNESISRIFQFSADLVKNVSGSIIFTVVEVERRIDEITQTPCTIGWLAVTIFKTFSNNKLTKPCSAKMSSFFSMFAAFTRKCW